MDTPEDLDSLTTLGKGAYHDCMAAFNVMLVKSPPRRGSMSGRNSSATRWTRNICSSHR